MVNFNPQKTESMVITRKLDFVSHPPLTMNQVSIKSVTSHKHLGLTFSSDGTWNTHIDEIISKASKRLNLIRKLKFKVDRKSLEKMYFSFIRPVLEYADVIWDNCPEYMKLKLEQINYEAARIVTGATKLTTISLLLLECGWETLEARRKKHKLMLFHKMVHGNTPEYLSNLVPASFSQTHHYRTRNANNLVPPPTHSMLYYNSFLPSTVRLWNDLPANIKNNDSINNLKSFLNKPITVPSYFYAGCRIGQILHARIRTESSALKDHLFKKNLEPDPYCKCKQIENSEHFLLSCPLFNRLRNILFPNLSCHINIRNLLYGDSNLSDAENTQNFLIVQKYIIKSKRFNTRGLKICKFFVC